MINIKPGEPYRGTNVSFEPGVPKTEDYTPNSSNDTQFINGQPKLNPKNSSDTAKTYYQLGRTSAALDQKRQDIEHTTAAMLIQNIMLEQTKKELQNILMSVMLNQKMMETQQANQQYPPLPGGAGGGAYPPLPGGQDQSQQPDMSQMGQQPDMSQMGQGQDMSQMGQGQPDMSQMGGQPQYQGQ